MVAESGIRTTRPLAYEASELTSAPSRKETFGACIIPKLLGS